jgi:hypothetical protein
MGFSCLMQRMLLSWQLSPVVKILSEKCARCLLPYRFLKSGSNNCVWVFGQKSKIDNPSLDISKIGFNMVVVICPRPLPVFRKG